MPTVPVIEAQCPNLGKQVTIMTRSTTNPQTKAKIIRFIDCNRSLECGVKKESGKGGSGTIEWHLCPIWNAKNIDG